MPDQTILPGGEFTSTTEYDLDGAVGTLQFRVVNKATGDIAIDWAPSAIVQVSASGEGPPWLYRATRDGIDALGTYRLQWRDETGNPMRQWTDSDELVVAQVLSLPTARARLERMLSPGIEPVLTEADIDELMVQARRPDRDGRLPSETGWIPTYDMDAAASAGWELRAGRCFDDIDFGEDGQRFNASQRHAQCLAMAKLYRRGAASVLVTTSAV